MIARIQAWLAALGVALLGIGAAWLRGRSAGRADAQARQDKAYVDTVERANEADLSRGDDAADRDWLHKRGTKR